MRVAENLDEAKYAGFRAQFAAAEATARLYGTVIDITAAGIRSPLRIRADLKTQNRLVVEGGEPRPALLSVNGKEAGLEILGEYR
jgi:hypothetical protein